MEDKENIIVQALKQSGNPMGNSDLRKATGLTQSQFSNAAKSLVEQGTIILEGERRAAKYRTQDSGQEPGGSPNISPQVEPSAPVPSAPLAPAPQEIRPSAPKPPEGKTLMEVFAEDDREKQEDPDAVIRFNKAVDRILKDGFTFVAVSEMVRVHTGCNDANQVIRENKLNSGLIEALEAYTG